MLRNRTFGTVYTPLLIRTVRSGARQRHLYLFQSASSLLTKNLPNEEYFNAKLSLRTPSPVTKPATGTLTAKSVLSYLPQNDFHMTVMVTSRLAVGVRGAPEVQECSFTQDRVT